MSIRTFAVRFSALRPKTQLGRNMSRLDWLTFGRLSTRYARNDRRTLVRLYTLIRPLAFALDAETAHRATIAALKLMPSRSPPRFPASLQTKVAGLDFPSPVGLAAGFDKDAEVPEEMLELGFGFVEVGTLTPRPQAGNSRPRLFRLADDRAVINRLGVTSQGQPAAFKRLQRFLTLP